MSNFEDDARRLAQLIQGRYSEAVIEVAKVLHTADRMCPLMGHDIHETIIKMAASYSINSGIDTTEVSACLVALGNAEKTMRELARIDMSERQPAPMVDIHNLLRRKS